MSALRTLSIGLLASTVALVASAQAQSATAQTEKTTPRFVTAVDMSPSGQRLAYTRLEAGKIVLVVSDIAGDPTVAASLPLETNAVLHLEWLNEDHLLYAERKKADLQLWQNTGDSILLLALEPEFTVASANLETITPLLTPKNREALPKASAFVSKLPHDPERILLSGWGGSGIVKTLYSVSLRDGSFEALDYGSRLTSSWSVDGAGRPALRIDRDKRDTELRVFASSHSGDNKLRWRQIGRHPIADGSTTTSDLIPLATGPAENEVYALARNGSGARRGIYVFDKAEEALVREVFQHDAWDVASAILDESGRKVVAVTLGDNRKSTVFLDPDKQAHMKAIGDSIGSASIVLEDISADESVWLFSVRSPGSGVTFVRYDLPTSHARVLLGASDLVQ